MSDPLLEGLEDKGNKNIPVVKEKVNEDPLLSGVENNTPIEAHNTLSDPLLEGISESHISNTLEENKLYGAGSPFYEIAKTVGKTILDSPIGPGLKTVLGFTRKQYDKAVQQQQIGEIQFQQQTHNPNFEYYANAAIRATLGSIFTNTQKAAEIASSPGTTLLGKSESIPAHFEMPNAEKYSPVFLALAKISGGDLNKVNDKMALGLGVDQLFYSGLHHVGKMVDVAGVEALKNTQKLDLLSQTMLDRNLAISKQAGLSVEEVTNKNLDGAIKGSLDDVEIASIKQAYDKSVPIGQELTPSEMLQKVDPTEIVHNDVVYKMQILENGKKLSISPLRPATAIDTANQIYKESANIITDAMGRDIRSIHDFLPKEGEVDISPDRFTKYGPAAIVMSPQTYAPVLFEQIGQLERNQARFKDTVFNELKPFWKQATEENANRVFRYTDYPWKIEQAINEGKPEVAEALKKAYSDLTQTITPFEMKWAEKRKSVFGNVADLLNIPKNDNYITHIIEDFQNKRYMPNPDISLDKNVGDRYLKERKGLPGYLEDAKKSDQMYADWAAKKFLNEFHQNPMLETIKKMKEIDEFSGSLAELYYHNYFGSIDQELPAWRNVKSAFNKLAAYPTAAWLTLNPNPTLLNVGQALMGGSAKIGYGPMTRGIKHAFQAMYGTSEEALAWKKILNDGAILMNKSMTEISPIKTFWERIPGVGKMFIAGKYPLQWAENVGKASIYLGGYEDAFHKIQSTKLGVKDWGKWLTIRGLNSVNDGGEEAFKYGRISAYEAHQDWTRAGQNTLQQFPISNVFMRFAQAPWKMTEFATKNVLGTAVDILGKSIPKFISGDFEAAKIAMSSPSVKTAARLAINYTLVTIACKKLGYDPARFLWDYMRIDKHTGRLVSAVIDGMKKVYDKWETKSPDAWKETAKYVGMLSGYPLFNVGGKVSHILDIANDPENKNRTDDKIFIKDPQNPKSGFYSDWTHVMVDTLTPAADMNKVDHYNQLKESSVLSKQITNMRKMERQATYEKDYARRNSIIQQRIKNQIEQRKLRQEIRNSTRGIL